MTRMRSSRRRLFRNPRNHPLLPNQLLHFLQLAQLNCLYPKLLLQNRFLSLDKPLDYLLIPRLRLTNLVSHHLLLRTWPSSNNTCPTNTTAMQTRIHNSNPKPNHLRLLEHLFNNSNRYRNPKANRNRRKPNPSLLKPNNMRMLVMLPNYPINKLRTLALACRLLQTNSNNSTVTIMIALSHPDSEISTIRVICSKASRSKMLAQISSVLQAV